MSCQEESHPFQILFIPGIYCHLLDRELLSFPLLSSPINQIYYFVFMFIFFLLTSYHSCPSVFISGVFWKSIHFEVASDSFSLLINSSWLLVFATILFVLIFPYIIYLVSLIFFSYHFWCRDLLRELDKKYEVLLIIFFHGLGMGLAFIRHAIPYPLPKKKPFHRECFFLEGIQLSML